MDMNPDNARMHANLWCKLVGASRVVQIKCEQLTYLDTGLSLRASDTADPLTTVQPSECTDTDPRPDW